MGIFVGTAFLAGILGKVAHGMRQRKKRVAANKCRESKSTSHHHGSAKKE